MCNNKYSTQEAQPYGNITIFVSYVYPENITIMTRVARQKNPDSHLILCCRRTQPDQQQIHFEVCLPSISACSFSINANFGLMTCFICMLRIAGATSPQRITTTAKLCKYGPNQKDRLYGEFICTDFDTAIEDSHWEMICIIEPMLLWWPCSHRIRRSKWPFVLRVLRSLTRNSFDQSIMLSALLAAHPNHQMWVRCLRI